MVVALMAGVGFALGHHFFYRSLAGTSATDTYLSLLGVKTSTQQLNIAIGTALAYLAKTCFLLAISIVYVQAFWRAAGKVAKKQMKLRHLDAVYSGLDDITAFFAVSIWARHPILLFIAVIAWYVVGDFVRQKR
jgi:hypothetical protein